MQLPTVTLCLTILGISLANAIVIDLQDGDIRGFTKTNELPSGTVSIFYGIPFAKPPVGELRFRKPQPPNPWNGTLDATKKPNSCPQAPPFFSDLPFAKNFEVTTNQSEDCLYLNVWTSATDVKNLKLSGNRDVIFWIHGGGFTVGGSMMHAYDGSYLTLHQNVVFVSINYRLGPLGFLYLGNEEAPGNMGLYDILMALDWVKKNIAAFGGNPASITIIGESAGGASVSALLLSPLGKGKFKNAVIQSGTMLSSWSHKSKEDALKLAKTVSETTGCSQITSSSWNNTQKQIPSSVIACLRKLEVKALNAAVYPAIGAMDFEVKIAPTIDGHFFPNTPIQMLKENINSANVMIGHTAKETSIFIFANKFLREADYTSNALGRIIISKNSPNLSNLEIELLQISYSDWTVADNITRNRDSIIDLLGDVTMVCPSVAFATAVSAINKVHYYEFQHVSSSLNKFLPPWVGATHALDIPFFLGTAFSKVLGFNKEDQKVSESIMKHLADFARTGNPSSSVDSPWPEFKANEPHVFIFGTSNRTSGSRIPKCTYFNENYPNWLLSSGILQSAKKDVCSVFNSAISQYYKLEIVLISFLFSIIFF